MFLTPPPPSPRVSVVPSPAMHHNGLSMNHALLGLSPNIPPGPKEGDLAHDMSHEMKRMHTDKGESCGTERGRRFLSAHNFLSTHCAQCMKNNRCSEKQATDYCALLNWIYFSGISNKSDQFMGPRGLQMCRKITGRVEDGHNIWSMCQREAEVPSKAFFRKPSASLFMTQLESGSPLLPRSVHPGCSSCQFNETPDDYRLQTGDALKCESVSDVFNRPDAHRNTPPPC